MATRRRQATRHETGRTVAARRELATVCLSALALVLMAGTPGPARATSQLFAFDSGAASLTLEAGGIRLNDEAAIAPLSGSFVEVELDAASGGPALLDFAFDLDQTTIAFDVPLAGVTALVLESATIAPDAVLYTGPTGSDLGDGEYAVGGGPLAFSIDYHLETLGGPTATTSASLVSPGITANLDVDGGTLSLLGTALGVLVPESQLETPLVLKADLVFRGLSPSKPGDVIPEPGGALLLAAGLAVTSRSVRRRSAERAR